MNMVDIKRKWEEGKIDKRLYWTIMRENYLHVIPQVQRMIEDSDDCESISITSEGCILENKRGLKMYFDFSQTICRAETQLIMGEDSEKEDMDYVVSYLKNNECKNVLDIGGNVGLFSLELYQSVPDVMYHVFEPIPSTYDMLNKTVRLNGVGSDSVKTYNLGISNEEGSFEFYLPASCEAASLRPINDEFYMSKSNDLGEYTGEKTLEKVVCKVDTVDSIVSKYSIDDIGFIKIDVEGNEKFVLEGAKDTLSNNKPLVYCELLRKHAKRFGYHPNDVIDYMKGFGYHCATIREGAMVDIGAITDDTSETNFFFLR